MFGRVRFPPAGCLRSKFPAWRVCQNRSSSVFTVAGVVVAEYMYEGMFLLDSNRYASDPAGAAELVSGLLNRCHATVVAHRPWQEGKLCYEIEGHRKGLYYLCCFKMDGSQIPGLNRICKLNEFVLRQLVLNHPKPIFDAMVESLTSQDGTIHSPEQRPDARDEAGGGPGGGRRGERGDDAPEY